MKNKSEGGLGLRNMHEMNLAFFTKPGWRMIQDKGRLWVKVLSGKCMKKKVQLEHVQPKHGSSNAWQGIVKAAPFLTQGLSILVWNG